MSKRRTQDSFDAEDSPIGLTGAFAPVKGPQSVDYDTNDDPVGLTQAFGVIPDDDEPRPWDEAGKWKDFDWDTALGEPVGKYGDAQDAQDTQPAEDAQQEQGAGDAEKQEAPKATESASAKTSGKHARHAAPQPELSPRMQKSRRTRRVLIVLIILLLIAIGAMLFFLFRTVSNNQHEVAQQTQEQSSHQRVTIESATTDDAHGSTSKLADVPNIASLLNMPQDQAIASIGRGALVTANREVNEEGNPIKVNLNVALTEEPADTKTGTPTVYLGLAEDSVVRQSGYSASATALGFGSLSFADAVSNEHVVEKTLAKAGINVPEGSAALPADKASYSTYASDGTTLIRERCSFEGDVDVNGVPCTWSAVLSYDYTTQVVTGNLNDTVRIIYVYITMK